jgi:hypothetical protein
MLKAEAELRAQIASLLDRAKAADEAQKNEPELDVPAEIARREDRLQAIQEARARLEKRQREGERERGRHADDPPRGGRYKRPFGIPKDKAQGELHRSGQPHHEACRWRLRCELQRPDGGG